MSFVIAAPEFLTAAATDLAGIGSTVSAASAAASAPTIAVLAAGGDEVSGAISALFGSYAQQYQALSAQTALFHDQFVQALNGGGLAYAAAEAASASPLAAAGSPIAGAFESFVYGPIHAVGEGWINSPFGQLIDPFEPEGKKTQKVK